MVEPVVQRSQRCVLTRRGWGQVRGALDHVVAEKEYPEGIGVAVPGLSGRCRFGPRGQQTRFPDLSARDGLFPRVPPTVRGMTANR